MTINDREWKFLAEQTGLSLPFNDLYFRYLRSLGFTGTLQDMIGASGFGLTPSDSNLVILPYDGGSPENWTVTPTELIGAAGSFSSTGYLNLKKNVNISKTYRVSFTATNAVNTIGVRFGEDSWFDGGTAYGSFSNGTHSIEISPSNTLGRLHFGGWLSNDDYATLSAVSVIELV